MLSSALCIRGLFRNEPLCMGIMWDIWASAYCSMAKVKACPPHRWLPFAIHHLRTQTAAKLTFQPLWTSSHQFGRTVFFMVISVYRICQYTFMILYKETPFNSCTKISVQLVHEGMKNKRETDFFVHSSRKKNTRAYGINSVQSKYMPLKDCSG